MRPRTLAIAFGDRQVEFAAGAEDARELIEYTRYGRSGEVQKRRLTPGCIDRSGSQREVPHVGLDDRRQFAGPQLPDR
jgi:hypothetical protein